MIKLNLKKTHSVVTVTLLLLLVLIIGYVYFLFIIFKINNEQRILGKEVQLQVKKDEHFRAIKKILADTRSERLELNTRFVSKEGVVSFIEKIESLSSVAGASVDIQSVNIIDAKSKAGYEWLELSVDVSGTWDEVYYLISLVEHLPMAASLFDVRIVYSNTDDGKEVWDGYFRVRAVKLKEK